MTSRTSSSYKVNNQIILPEHPEEVYQPTDEEIYEYAIYIGIDPEKEIDLLWLAREGIMKCLPPGWKPCQDERGELYYFNFDTGKSSWEHPYDHVYKKRVIREREKKILPQMNSVSHLLDKSNPTLNRSNRTSNIDSSPNENDSDADMNNLDLSIKPIQQSNEQKLDFEATIEESDHPIHFVSPLDETSDLQQFRQRIQKSTDDEKLSLLEDHRLIIEEFKRNLRFDQEKEEDLLRERMKNELLSMENQMRETIRKEKKVIEVRQQTELKHFQQNCEREKQELEKEFKSKCFNEFHAERQKETNRQILAIEIKYEYEERIRLLENRYKKEIEDLNRKFDQIKLDRENLEKRLKEKNEICSNLRRTIDQLHRQIQEESSKNNNNNSLWTRQISTDLSEQDSINLQSKQDSEKKTFHSMDDDNNDNDDDDDDERLSETDSDVIEMKQTLKALEDNQLQPLSKISPTKIPPIPTDSIHFNNKMSFDRYKSPSLFDSGHWTTSNTSIMTNTLTPLSLLKTSPISSNSNTFWSSVPSSTQSFQSSLITREAVLKAARDVLPPGVLDHLTLNI